ncbi:MAG: Gfo/Idh/MocA family oxidoreductase [Acidobacteriota bacterium]|nr:Gfo/Idh/MocA family oxidoreductase [Acidobacteriota bacterium]
MKEIENLTRRDLLKGAATAAAAGAASAAIVPRHVLGGPGNTAPSDTVYVAGIGLGTMGRFDVRTSDLAGSKIAALCDVDNEAPKSVVEMFPKAERYDDFRRLLDEEKGIDAVIVATPDHAHALISLAAMEHGLHVYCEKPLAHTMYEVRRLQEAAVYHGVATQLGNQGHSYASNHEFCEAIWSGVIGTVREIHVVEAAFNFSRIEDLPRLEEKHPVPKSLNWDRWLGPAAERSYHPLYHPGLWRCFRAFGSGMIGDFVCHIVDPVFTALQLGAPSSVHAEVADGYDPQKHGDTFPRSSKVRFEFPEAKLANGGVRPALTMYWYDGDVFAPPHPEELGPDEVSIPLLGGRGAVGGLVVGDRGKITYASHGAAQWRILPEERMDEYMADRSRVEDERGVGMPNNFEHHEDFLQACRGYKVAGSHFGHGGPLTEIAMLGNVALMFPEDTLAWDAENMTIPNRPDANAHLHYRYRDGWTL